MDITYIPMARGFIYLAAVLDWFTRRVLAWRVSITPEAEFCIEAVEEVPPVSGKLSAALLFLYFSGGRDRTITWDIHRNANLLC